MLVSGLNFQVYLSYLRVQLTYLTSPSGSHNHVHPQHLNLIQYPSIEYSFTSTPRSPECSPHPTIATTMSTPAARPGLDLHRRSYAPVPEPQTLPHILGNTPATPQSTIRRPALSDISEEHSLATRSSESHIPSLDGAAEDFSTAVPAAEAAQERRRRRRDRLKPGFRNAPPFRVFVRRNWLDIVTQLVCLLVAWMIYLFAKPLMPRYFPLYPGIGTSAWGLNHGKPLLREYVSTPVSAVVSFVVPLLVMGAFGLWGTRDFWESNAAVCPLIPLSPHHPSPDNPHATSTDLSR